ncbi:hypothetical protein E2542_SST00017 [Spatholobus suberectus]|nr:hypothetical protein E2542_SST00017 [Spatholobus suberectus]
MQPSQETHKDLSPNRQCWCFGVGLLRLVLDTVVVRLDYGASDVPIIESWGSKGGDRATHVQKRKRVQLFSTVNDDSLLDNLDSGERSVTIWWPSTVRVQMGFAAPCAYGGFAWQ